MITVKRVNLCWWDYWWRIKHICIKVLLSLLLRFGRALIVSNNLVDTQSFRCSSWSDWLIWLFWVKSSFVEYASISNLYWACSRVVSSYVVLTSKWVWCNRVWLELYMNCMFWWFLYRNSCVFLGGISFFFLFLSVGGGARNMSMIY